MENVNIFIRFSNLNVQLEQIGTLSKEDSLIFNDEGGSLKAHLKTSVKFALLTAGSPLITLARLVRSAVFLFAGQFNDAGREFIGSLATPFVAAGCLIGALLASAVYAISSGNHSFFISTRRTYAYFEAWVNRIDFANLSSYSNRVSDPFDAFKGRIWTTAPCMQPLLENGLSIRGGVLDAHRMQKIFPFVNIKDVRMEQDQVVIQSEYENEAVVYTACNGAYQHGKLSTTFCCCFRIEAVYDRLLCCEVAQGSCTSIMNPGDSCGIVSAGCCGVEACCCYVKENNSVTAINTGCLGNEGISCLTSLSKREIRA